MFVRRKLANKLSNKSSLLCPNHQKLVNVFIYTNIGIIVIFDISFFYNYAHAHALLLFHFLLHPVHLFVSCWIISSNQGTRRKECCISLHGNTFRSYYDELFNRNYNQWCASIFFKKVNYYNDRVIALKTRINWIYIY